MAKTYYQALNISDDTWVGIPTNKEIIGEGQVSMMTSGTITFHYSNNIPDKAITSDIPRDFVISPSSNISAVTSTVQVVMS